MLHRWFSQLSLTLIIVFSIMLALYDPLDPDNETWGNRFISVCEKVFTVFFTIEVRSCTTQNEVCCMSKLKFPQAAC